MSKLTDDDIEALASGSATRRSSDISLDYLDEEDDNQPNASQGTSSVPALPPPRKPGESTKRYQAIGERTNQLLTEYKDFVSDMEEITGAEELGGSYSSEAGENDDGGQATKAGSGWSHGGPWKEDHRHNNSSFAPVNLATIREDDTYTGSSSLWPEYPGLGYGYGYNRRRNYKCWMVMVTIAFIALLAAIPSFAGTKNQRKNDGNPSDLYARPPTLEEDDLSNDPPWLKFKAIEYSIDMSIHPLWFSEENGWTGTNYSEGMTFCKSIHESRYVCPYEIYCPGGPGMPAFKMEGAHEEEIWAPLWDDQEIWVSVGTKNACLQKGIMDESNKAKVKYVLCCNDDVEDNSEQGQSENEQTEEVTNISEDNAIENKQPEEIKDNSEGNKTEIQQSKEHEQSGQKHHDHDEKSQPVTSTSAYSIIDSVLNKEEEESSSTAQPTSKPTADPQTPSPTSHDEVGPLILTHNEQAALDYMNPQWYSRKDGYNGETHKSAVEFCNTNGGRQLCPPEAYCPNGSQGASNPKPLFLRMSAFDGEQYAATSLNSNSWLLIGKLDNDPSSTCQMYEVLHGGAQPLWGFDGTNTELKEYVLCCLENKGDPFDDNQQG